MKKSRLKIGEILVRENLLTEADLAKAVDLQKQSGGEHLGAILVRMGFVKEQDLAGALGKQLGLAYAKTPDQLFPATDQNLEKLIPVDLAREKVLLPLSRQGGILTIAMADPLDLMTLENLKHLSHCEIEVIVATRTDILKAIDAFYGQRALLEDAIAASQQEKVEEIQTIAEEKDLSVDELVAKAEDAPVVRLVDLLIRQAIEDRASDVHIEPMREKIDIRYRIDGTLYEIAPPPRHLLLPIVSRIKILSNMDIAEKRLPQDGAFSVKYQDRQVDLRISTIPTVHGEKVVMRILDKGKMNLDLRSLGFDQKQLEDFQSAISHPYGLVFITGPTGSGKTTTLYAALNFVKSPKKNILTIEDPVEYKLDGVNQVQVKPEIGLTFAAGLRAFLRQDPDIMMVGEVRDLETAQICVRAALTGHMVFSTLHTNDAVGTIPRLIDIGVEPYLVSASLTLVAAQRLVRRLCQECRTPYEPEKELLEQTGMRAELLYNPKGCQACNFIGYKGRIAIYEVLPASDRIKQLTLKRTSDAELKALARQEGMATLRESGFRKVEQGQTTAEEVLQATIETGE